MACNIQNALHATPLHLQVRTSDGNERQVHAQMEFTWISSAAFHPEGGNYLNHTRVKKVARKINAVRASSAYCS